MEGLKYWQECRVLFDMTNISERTWNHLKPTSFWKQKWHPESIWKAHTKSETTKKADGETKTQIPPKTHVCAGLNIALHVFLFLTWPCFTGNHDTVPSPKKMPADNNMNWWVDSCIPHLRWKAVSFLGGFFKFNKAPLHFNVFHSHAEILFWRLRKCFWRTSTSCREVKHIIRSLWEKSRI